MPALRSFVTANYDQPNPHNQAAMASPPTITATDNIQPTGLTTEYRPQNGSDGLLTYTGGKKTTFATSYVRFPCAKEYTSGVGGTAGGGLSQVVFRTWLRANAAKVSFSVLDIGENYRFIVDGQYVSLTGTPIAGTSGRVYYEIDFGSAALRTLAVEGIRDHGFERFGIAPANAPILAIAPPKRMIVVGDSFVWGAGATLNGDGLAMVAGDMLGIYDTWQSGTGGTGYLGTLGGTKFALTGRLGDVNDNGPWDVIAVATGLNDIGQASGDISAAVATCLSSFRLNNPAAQIIVVGPWDVAAPSAPSANYTACKAAIQAGIPSGAGITFVDPEGVSYTKADATHPDTAGHKTLGDWLALAIKNALGA